MEQMLDANTITTLKHDTTVIQWVNRWFSRKLIQFWWKLVEILFNACAIGIQVLFDKIIKMATSQRHLAITLKILRADTQIHRGFSVHSLGMLSQIIHLLSRFFMSIGSSNLLDCCERASRPCIHDLILGWR